MNRDEPLPPSPTPSPPSPPSPAWLRVFSVALKLAVIGLIGLAVWQIIVAYRGVLPGGRNAVPTPPPTTPAVTAPTTPTDWLLESAGWSLGDTPWRVTRATLGRGDRITKLSALSVPPPARAPHELETALIQWLKEADPAPTRNGAVQQYKILVNNTVLRGVVETTTTGERLRLGQVSWPGEAGQWELLELLPLGGSASPPPPPLLPTPTGATVIARRWAGERVVADVVGPLPLDGDPFAGWQSAGWVGTPEHSDTALPAVRWTRGSDARVVVRLPAPPGTPNRDHLLIFLPLPDSHPEPNR